MTSEAYLRRLGIDARPGASVESLRALHRAHVERIPYDNLSIQLDRPDDVPSSPQRAADGGRLGYCFQQNTAFEALLEMVSRDIHHLPVVDETGRPVGLVTTTDLVRLENANPVYLAASIGGQTTLSGVVAEAPGIRAVLGQHPRDPPGDRVIVRDPHDEAALALHQSRH